MTVLNRGDKLFIQTVGGGEYGPATERDATLRDKDKHERKVLS